MNPEKPAIRVPWMTEDGYIDPVRILIDDALRQVRSEDDKQFRGGLSVLSMMCAHGRQEAGVFLLDLLVTCDDRWERRIKIVESMRGLATKSGADVLFGELKRVKSSNTTRRYLTAVIEVLLAMPWKLVQDGFRSLAQDKSFSPKMREKFEAVLLRGAYGSRMSW